MTSESDTTRQIASLDDQQVLLVIDSLAVEFMSPDAPEESDEQAEALGAWLRAVGFDVDAEGAVEADPATAAAAGRDLLRLVGDLPEFRDTLEAWLANPPVQESAAVPLILAAPVVLTLCVMLVELVEDIHFEYRDGKWVVSKRASSLRDKKSTTSLAPALAKVILALGRGLN